VIVGARPCCGAPSVEPYGGTGVFQRIICDECGAGLWLRHSNLDPELLTDDEFQKQYTVEGRTVRPR
jgi:hypothetical protein